MVNKKRVRVLKEGKKRSGPVVYWMSRDQRTRGNWALLFAQEMALEQRESLVVLFCLVPKFLDATIRQYDFMLKGLEEVEEELTKTAIPFHVRPGSPDVEIPEFVRQHRVGALVTDFDPLRIKKGWKTALADRLDIPFYEVDTRNIVPCWATSPKQEYGAYTLRPKIRRALPEFLEPFPALKGHPIPWSGRVQKTDWKGTRRALQVDNTVPEVDWIAPGPKSGQRVLKDFLKNKLGFYDERSNDPTVDGLSNLSPYLHFGQISAQQVALEVSRTDARQNAKEAFLEELIVRRELSDNYCFYNENYDRFEGFPDWAKRTLNDHRRDAREYVYSIEEFENTKTHDDLWNAAQSQMARTGKMHSYMRMYWAKKILEWSESPEEALKIAIYLNDRYELDGRETNGYVGISWSIGGLHDRAWGERAVFGKIRYMSYRGCKSKFDVAGYIEKNRP